LLLQVGGNAQLRGRRARAALLALRQRGVAVEAGGLDSLDAQQVGEGDLEAVMGAGLEGQQEEEGMEVEEQQEEQQEQQQEEEEPDLWAPPAKKRQLPDGGGELSWWPTSPCLRCGCAWWRGVSWEAPCGRCGWDCHAGGYAHLAEPLPGRHQAAYDAFVAHIEQGSTPEWHASVALLPAAGGCGRGGEASSSSSSSSSSEVLALFQPPAHTKELAAGRRAWFYADIPCLRCGCPWWLGEGWEVPCARCGVLETYGYAGVAEPLPHLEELYEQHCALVAQGTTPAWQGPPGLVAAAAAPGVFDPPAGAGPRELAGTGLEMCFYANNPCLLCGCPWWLGHGLHAPCARCGAEAFGYDEESGHPLPEHVQAYQQHMAQVRQGGVPGWDGPLGEALAGQEVEEGLFEPPELVRELPGGVQGHFFPQAPCLSCGCPWWLGEGWEVPCARCGVTATEFGYSDGQPLPEHEQVFEYFCQEIEQGRTPPWLG
jgi:hypothetical protein